MAKAGQEEPSAEEETQTSVLWEEETQTSVFREEKTGNRLKAVGPFILELLLIGGVDDWENALSSSVGESSTFYTVEVEKALICGLSSISGDKPIEAGSAGGIGQPAYKRAGKVKHGLIAPAHLHARKFSI